MYKRYKKFLVIILSALLILSNFSFAVSYTLCTMGVMKESCSSIHHKSHPINTDVNLSKAKRSCCEERISELSNSNTLLIDHASNYNASFNYVGYNVDNFSIIDNNTLVHNHFTYPGKIPKNGIPITISSLLI